MPLPPGGGVPQPLPSAKGFWQRALRHRSFMAGGVLTLLVISAALLSLVWTPWPAYEIDMAHKLNPPSCGALARHRHARPRYRLAAAGRRPKLDRGRHHRGRHRPAVRRLVRAARGRPQGMGRGADHAAQRLHLCVSGAALGDHAGGGGGAGHGDVDHGDRHFPDPDLRAHHPWFGQRDLGAGIRAGGARLRQGQIPHHASSMCCPISSRS